MKKLTLLLISFLLISTIAIGDNYKQLSANNNPDSVTNNKKEIIKKGISLGPLPVVAFDQDKGFQYGALLNIYNFGDGSWYPNPKSQWYFEASAYTKGSYKFEIIYDNKALIKNTRMCIAGRFSNEKALDFYGFNGYQSFYDKDLPTAFYRHGRAVATFKADFIGKITPNFSWKAGYNFSYFKTKRFESENLTEPSLYDIYISNNIIDKDDADGGISSSLRFGLMYDTRDVEASPTKGIWSEAHAIAAPKFLGSSKNYFKFNFIFHQYVPIATDKLVFAYRLNYQGFIGNAPFYVLPFHSIVGPFSDYDGIGGYRTTRGLMRNRVQSLQFGFFNTELRWRFVDFRLFNQNIALNLSGFLDGARSFKHINLSALETTYPHLLSDNAEKFHLSAGAGLRIIMNRNFIVAFEYGKAFNSQDNSKGAIYINSGFLF